MKTITKNETLQKFISFILVISVFLPSVILLFSAREARAQGMVPVSDVKSQALLKVIAKEGTTTAVTTVKSWLQKVLEGLLKMAAKMLLARMTQATVDWINRGFHGSPLFIENPSAFFKDIAKSQVRLIVDMIGYDTFRFPFGKQTALNVISSYKSQLATNAQYTLSKVINDPDLLVRYRNDFNYGGWNGFLINTQYPQNNYLGFNMIIEQNLASRLQGTLVAPAQKVENLLQQGMGFLSPQTCPSNPNYNNGKNEFVRPSFKMSPAPPGESEEAYHERYRIESERWNDPHGSNVCPGGLVSTTPGSVAANQVIGALNVPFLQTALDGAIGNSIAAIFDALLNKLLSTGLNAMTGGLGGSSSDDNWSYYGVNLDTGRTTGGRTITSLNIPSSASIRVGESTSTPISGGTAPYTITSGPLTTVARANISSSGSSGYTLTTEGVTPGTTQITIRDSGTSCPRPDGTFASGPCTANVAIAVNAIGVLAINPATISPLVNETITASISGGNGNYSIQVGTNQAIAVAGLAGSNLIVTGIGPGRTSVLIRDSSTPARELVIPINVSVTAVGTLVVPQNIGVVVGTQFTSTIPITGGTKPYSATVADPTIATATIAGLNADMLSILGIRRGNIQVTISDSTPAPDIQFGNTNVAITDLLTVDNTGNSLSWSTRICSSSNPCYKYMTIRGGTGSYSVQSTVPSIATVSMINTNTLRITTFRATGNTQIFVRDSATPPQTVIINTSITN